MKWLSALEGQVLKWAKDVPHLPSGVHVWLAANVWWIVLLGTILSTIGALFTFFQLINLLTLLGSPQVSYFVSSTFIEFSIFTSAVSFFFIAVQAVILAMSITPLKERQKKGWVLLFLSWLVSVVAMVLNPILTLDPFSLFTGIIFGVIFATVWGYFLFEIHGQFAHPGKAEAVKSEEAAGAKPKTKTRASMKAKAETSATTTDK